MRKLRSILAIAFIVVLVGCGRFDGTSAIDLGADQSVTAGTQVTIAGQIADMSGTMSTDDTGFTIDFDLDTPDTSEIVGSDVTQSGPIFIFTPDVAGEYYFYAWVFDNANPGNIGVDVVKITAT